MRRPTIADRIVLLLALGSMPITQLARVLCLHRGSALGRISHLMRAGLVESDSPERLGRWPGYRFTLTEAGRQLAERLMEVRA